MRRALLVTGGVIRSPISPFSLSVDADCWVAFLQMENKSTATSETVDETTESGLMETFKGPILRKIHYVFYQ